MSTHVVHATTVKGAAPPSRKLLEFLSANNATIRRMGITLRVKIHTPADLAKSGYAKSLASAGITSLPALLTGTGVTLGAEKIIALYRSNIARFRKQAAATEDGPGSRDDGDVDLSEHMRRAIMPDTDVDDDGGDEDDNKREISSMMNAYGAAMSRRGGSAPARGRSMPTAATGAMAGGAPTVPATPGRANNIAAPDDITRTINSLDDDEPGEGSSPVDDQMQAALLARID